MAKVIDGEIRGKVRSELLGEMVVYGDREDARVRSKGAAPAQQSDLQLWNVAKLANVVAIYQKLKPIVQQTWDDRLAERKKNGKPKGAPYNRFVSVNMQERGCALWPKADDPAGCVAAPYQITNGLLEPIRVVPIGKDGKAEKRSIDDCPRARTNIRIGGLVVNKETRIADLAEAIVNENDGWEWGDTLLYVQVKQNVRKDEPMSKMLGDEEKGERAARKHPSVEVEKWWIPIEANERRLGEVADLRWVQNVNGYIGQGEETEAGGYCWVHLRGVVETEPEEIMSEEEIRERMEEILGLEEEDEYLLPEESVVPNKKKKRKDKEVLMPLECSTQKMVCNNKELLAEFRSDEHVRYVIARYRAIAKVPKKKRAVEKKDSWTGEKLEWGM